MLVSVTVPEQVAVPLVHVAVVGAAVQLCPREVIVIAPATPLVTAIVAVAVQAALKVPSDTFPVPLSGRLLTYVAVATPVAINPISGCKFFVVVELTVIGEYVFSAATRDALEKFPDINSDTLRTDGERATML